MNKIDLTRKRMYCEFMFSINYKVYDETKITVYNDKTIRNMVDTPIRWTTLSLIDTDKELKNLIFKYTDNLNILKYITLILRIPATSYIQSIGCENIIYDDINIPLIDFLEIE